VLSVSLEVRIGSWRPEGDGGKAIDSIYAFAEVGRPPSTPGPMIRVPVGTAVRGTLHNTLTRPLVVFGLGKRRGAADSLVIAAGATSDFAFTADQGGTFAYFARTHVDTIVGRDPTEQQLNGAIVVDRPNAPRDRVFGISWIVSIDFKSPNGVGKAAMAINGLSWPHTERLAYAQGDSIHWRLVNFTEFDHPMHLHGFYFRVDGRGDSLYTAAQQRMAVTEVVNPFDAVELSWKADRPGNWVFHCHYAVHISDFVTLDMKNGALDASEQMHHQSNAPHQMYGLVMGITGHAERTASRRPSAGSCHSHRTARATKHLRQTVGNGVRRDTRGTDKRHSVDAGARANTRARARQTSAGDDRQSLDAARGGSLARHRARELSRWRARMEWSGKSASAIHRAKGLTFRSLDTAARRLVHVSLALQRSKADGRRTLRSDRRPGAGRDLQPRD
jgi:hypothetical protein